MPICSDSKGEQTIQTMVCPFTTIREFYSEYCYHCDVLQTPGSKRARYTLFKQCFNELKQMGIVKLRTGKSGFPVCGMCNNIFGLKKSASCKKDEVTRDVLLKLSRLHLLQQKTERLHADNKVEDAKKISNGQPVLAYFDIDAQSVWTGNTPKFSRKNDQQWKMSSVIENRNIGVRIVCGPIDEYISVCTDNLIPHGANVLVEVVRFALKYLGSRLQAVNMVLPRKLALQFDNSGEQKVRLLSITRIF